MTDQQLRIFVVAARQKSMTQAAVSLFISVPAVKRHIDSLERELDCKLFHRGSRGLVLTEEGLEFLDFSTKALKSLTEERRKLALIATVRRNVIRVGYDNEHVRDHIFLDACAEYLNLTPSVSIHTEASSYFDGERYDLFFGASFPRQDNIASHFLGSLPLMCVFPAAQSACRDNSIPLEQLDLEKTIFPPSEMLTFVEPDLLAQLSGTAASFQAMTTSASRYTATVLLEGKTIIYIGYEEIGNQFMAQLPLAGFRFPYRCYTYHENDKLALKAFVRFLKNYYADHLPR